MLTKSGVKLLDFGLAKLRDPQSALVSVGATEADVTVAGEVLGTLQDTAPEQLEGARHRLANGHLRIWHAAARDDHWPEGVRWAQPDEPDALDHERYAAARVDAPAGGASRAGQLIATCLAKDPDDRWQSARDVERELTWVLKAVRRRRATSSAGEGKDVRAAEKRISIARAVGPRPGCGRRRRRCNVGAETMWRVSLRSPSPVLTMPLPPGDRIGDLRRPSLRCPDRDVARLHRPARRATQIFVRAVDSLEHAPSPERLADAPFFSPDGQSIGFFSTGT